MFEAFVRARDENGRWGAANVAEDLDDVSFRRFMVKTFSRIPGALVCVVDDREEHPYQCKAGIDFAKRG